MNKKVYKNYGEVDFEDHQTEQIEEQCEKDRKEIEGGNKKWMKKLKELKLQLMITYGSAKRNPQLRNRIKKRNSKDFNTGE